ncbi:MAG: hypothetical protein ACKV0T_10900 [Planctomycetales bacterium]
MATRIPGINHTDRQSACSATSLGQWILLGVVWCFLAPASKADENVDVAAIVHKAIKAVGGEDKLLRLFRWREQYYIGESETGTIREATLQPPDHWWQDKQDIAKDNPDRLDKTHLVEAWTLVPLTSKETKLTLLPEIKIDDQPAVGLRMVREGKADLSLYFDKESGLLARMDWRTFHITFGDWKVVDGVKYPSKSFVHTREGKLHLWTQFLEIERLKSLPEDRIE